MVVKLASFDSLIIEFGEVGRESLKLVRGNYEILKKEYEVVPSYNSILVKFGIKDFEAAKKEIVQKLRFEFEEIKGSLKIVPVWYGGEDIKRVADFHKMSEKEIIKTHSQKEYDVYAIGFLPGFAYMGFVDIPTPRIAPKKVKKGSVGIADIQTGIYPKESLGGWNIIGYTYLDLFDGDSFFKVGDRVKFEAISKSEYVNRGGVVD